MSNYKKLDKIIRSLRLSETAEYLPELLKKAEKQDLSYTQFLLEVMSYEQRRQGEKLIERRMKWATFPVYKTLNEFSLNEQPSLTKKQFNQLADLSWLDQVYNLILLISEEH